MLFERRPISMGILIRAVDPRQPVPRDVEIILTCDGDHGLMPPPRGRFEYYDGAMAAGWKETYRDDRRCFLCPACSGKPVK
jgi:hypothetical protein